MIQSSLNKTHLTFELRYTKYSIPYIKYETPKYSGNTNQMFFFSRQANMIKLPNETDEFW